MRTVKIKGICEDENMAVMFNPKINRHPEIHCEDFADHAMVGLNAKACRKLAKALNRAADETEENNAPTQKI